MPWYGSGGVVLAVALVIFYVSWVVGTVKRQRRKSNESD